MKNFWADKWIFRFQKKLKAPPAEPEGEKKAKGSSMGGQVHNILMDEFKKAHQKMFRNGYAENDYQQLLKNDETDKITALEHNEHKLEVSRCREQLAVDLR